MFKYGTGQRVERNEVCDYFVVLNYETLNHPLSWKQEVGYFLFAELDMHPKLLQIRVQQFVHLGHILYSHCSQTCNLGLFWKFVQFHIPRHWGVLGQ